jgi:hypothetical protein
MCYINKSKDKDHMIISINVEKNLEQNPTVIQYESPKETRKIRLVPQHNKDCM